jgi:hypothetical protein
VNWALATIAALLIGYATMSRRLALSVYAHGLTARSLTERYTRWWSSHPRAALPTMESVPAAEHRLRVPSRALRPAGAADAEVPPG